MAARQLLIWLQALVAKQLHKVHHHLILLKAAQTMLTAYVFSAGGGVSV